MHDGRFETWKGVGFQILLPGRGLKTSFCLDQGQFVNLGQCLSQNSLTRVFSNLGQSGSQDHCVLERAAISLSQDL